MLLSKEKQQHFYLYRFLDDTINVIYIGKTKQKLSYRFKNHTHLPDECYAKVYKIEYLECCTETDMSMKEIYYINDFHSKGQAEYNVADVSTPSSEFQIEGDEVWQTYTESLPPSFKNSINVKNGYTDKKHNYVFRSDGVKVPYSYNTKKGIDKFVYPIDIHVIESIIDYYISNMETAENDRYMFYHFRSMVLICMGISTPMKHKDLLSLKIRDVYDSNGNIRSYSYVCNNQKCSFHYPPFLIQLFQYYRVCIQDILRKSSDYWLFWGQSDDGKPLSSDALTKSLSKLSKELQLPKRISTESLRKTFLRNLYEDATDKYEVLEYLEFFIGESSRHSPGRILKYIGVLDRDAPFDPSNYIKDKFILNHISSSYFDKAEYAMKLLRHRLKGNPL